MKAQGDAAERFAGQPASGIWAVLLFGSDRGVSSDAAEKLIKAWESKGDPLDVVRLDEDAVRKEPSILFDNLEAVSLLGGDRLLKISISNEKIGALLVEAIKLGETSPDRFAAKLVIVAGDLAKRSKLRTEIEAAKHAAALHFFADDAKDMPGLVRAELLASGAGIEPDALAAFIGDLPGHRGLAHAEIEKLSLYAHALGRPLSIDDIKALAATDIDHGLSDIVGAALDGQAAAAEAALDKVLLAGTSSISILRAMHREATRMLQAHSLSSVGGNPGMKLRPPVWQTEWPAFSARLRTWPPSHLVRILERLYEAELQAKRSGPSAEPVLRVLINDLARVAASRAA